MHLPTPKALDCANLVFSAMWIWWFTTLTPMWYELSSLACWAPRTALGIVFGNARLSIALHTVVTLADVAVFFAHAPLPYRIPQGTESKSGYAQVQLFILFVVSALTWNFEDLLCSEADALLEARRSNQASALVHRLLSALCDCIVYIDSDLRITEPCPKLATLLLRPSASSSSPDQSFLTFMPPAERERFSDYINEEMSRQTSNKYIDAPARALHLNLVDA